MLRIAALLAAVNACSWADLRVTREVPQGGVVRIEGAPANAAAAVIDGGKEVPLFPAPDGSRRGLAPVVYSLTPGPHSLQLRDATGATLHTASIAISDGKFPVQNIQATRAMKQLKPLPGEMDAMQALHRSVTEQRRWEDAFAAPVPECVNSAFGLTRLHNGKPSGGYHRGLDQRSPPGAAIRAAASGSIKVARMFRLHGGTVGIDHGQGLTSHYLHMSKILAKEGQVVKQGDVIGEVGSTGFATGPHLHWGVYLFAVPVNPRLWAANLQACSAR